MNKTYLLTLAIAGLCLISCNRSVKIRSRSLLLEVNEKMETRVNNTASRSRSLMAHYSLSEYLVCNKFDVKEFRLKKSEINPFSDKFGRGAQTVILGEYDNDGYTIQKRLEYSVYDSFPDMALLKVCYINAGKKQLQVIKWVNHHYTIDTAGDSPAFWSFQGSSTAERKDWILPVDTSFSQKNYMGMNNTDYGGGIPVIDLWRKDAGIAIGHAEKSPRLVCLPVDKDKYDRFAEISVQYEYPEPMKLSHGDTLHTLTTFVSVHKGDYYSALKLYSKFMQSSGIQFAPLEPEAFQAVWCAWGYMRKFTVDEIVGTLPKVKELGLKWVDIDDGYQQSEGDWDVTRTKFPDGGKDMRKLVDTIHAIGLKAKLWWAPLAVKPGSQLFSQNPDIILESADGAPRFITWWDSYYMSPDYSKTIDHTKSVLKMFLQDWDYDGLKMDGQHLNCVPPDFNGRHHLADPVKSFEDLPMFYKMIYETARTFKPHAVLQICPCGCAMSFFNMPWMNQAVASDPVSSWQTRIKGKTYKALLGRIAYYGDHVELSDGGNDFESQIGIGAVLGTKFTWPSDNPFVTEGKFVLTPEKEQVWKHWINIYNQKMLSREEYLGALYDIGYDKPETHVIQKSDTLFYAFYNKDWKGKIQLRGLKKGKYRIIDYVNGKDLGMVSGKNPGLEASFRKNLLIEVYPEKK